MKYVLPILIFLTFSQGEKEDTVYYKPPVLDTIFKAHVKNSLHASVSEVKLMRHFESHYSEFQYFLSQEKNEWGLHYSKSHNNPKKSVLFRNHGKDVWTLDSSSGRIRKIAYHKKKEPVNNTHYNYWLVFPTFLMHDEYQVHRDYTLDSNRRVIKLKSRFPFPYLRMDLEIHPKTKLIQKADFIDFWGIVSKRIHFEHKNKDTSSTFSKLVLTDFTDGTKTVWQFQNIQSRECALENLSNFVSDPTNLKTTQHELLSCSKL